MSDDLLQRASQALRDAKEGSSDRSAETRARLLASAQRTRPRRGRWTVVVLPLAAALAVSGVWAGATGRLTSAWHSLVTTPETAPTEPVPTVATVPMPANSSTMQEAPHEVEQAPTAIEVVPSAAPAARSAERSGGIAGPREVPSDADHAAYLTAHRTHFGGGDPAAALAAWDRYLRAFPRGRFALEARYNRALCLVKLGRNAEASQALEPFARGAYGSYRQQEAQALRDALGAQ